MLELMDYRHIAAPDLYSFLLEVLKAKEEGFELSEQNEYFPQCYLTSFTCTMLKKLEDKPKGKKKAEDKVD